LALPDVVVQEPLRVTGRLAHAGDVGRGFQTVAGVSQPLVWNFEMRDFEKSSFDKSSWYHVGSTMVL
jgi:hypothetical protein